MRIRRVKRTDIAQLARLYYETVHRVNVRDYSAGQQTVWQRRRDEDDVRMRQMGRHRENHGLADLLQSPAGGDSPPLQPEEMASAEAIAESLQHPSGS